MFWGGPESLSPISSADQSSFYRVPIVFPVPGFPITAAAEVALSLARHLDITSPSGSKSKESNLTLRTYQFADI
jgi:hypothetical protein